MGGAASRRKGNRAELDVANWLRANGWKAVTTRSTSGAQGGADLVTDAPVMWEVKNHARLALSEWVAQAVRNARPNRPGVVIHKKPGKTDPGEWYVTMRACDLLDLLRTIGPVDDPNIDP